MMSMQIGLMSSNLARMQNVPLSKCLPNVRRFGYESDNGFLLCAVCFAISQNVRL